MIVYRVQDEDGRGPWKPGLSRHWVIDRADHENLLPWTASVTRAQLAEWFRRYRHLACGCVSPDTLRRWFTKPEYETLLSMGYNSVQLLADAVLWQDETQVVFGRHAPLTRQLRYFDLWSDKATAHAQA